MANPPVHIDSVNFGEIVINGKIFDSDMTLFWNGKMSYRSKEHLVEMGEFMKILMSKPEIVVIGIGMQGAVKIAPEVAEWAENVKVKIYTEVTPKAAEMFNAFVSEGRRTAGIFHVTC